MQETDLPEPEDREAEGQFGYITALIALEQSLRSIPDGLAWLSLLERGYSGHEAMRMLRRDWQWLKRVREVCRRALYP